MKIEHRRTQLALSVFLAASLIVVVVAAVAPPPAPTAVTEAGPAPPGPPASAGAEATGTRVATTSHRAGAPVSADATSTPARASAARGRLTVTAAGDVIGDREVGSFIDAAGGRAVFTEVAPLLRQADLTFVNLESPLSTRGGRDSDKDVTFRGRPALVAGLSSAGIDVVSLANNHALDYGPVALKDTLAALDKAGIVHAGAGADLTAARAPGVVKTPGGTVALLAYSLIEPAGFPAGKERPGINPGREEELRLLRDIARAKAKADWVVVSFHWGTEHQGRADEDQRRLAHRAIDAGADLVLGHHPHVLQGFELYRNRLIAYSLGDFVFDHYSRVTGETVILRANLNPTGPPSFTLVPVYLSDSHGIPAPVTGAQARSILERMRLYSGELGLEIKVDGDRATYPAATD